ncbi:Cold-shock DNA-binding domain protein [Novipirellula galeiformis]|uniref:Cold-shock DNA-binding domain protein n=1 Tax=Novipirellula galeiformis TaxID=2528004 RepID=A0A5C6CBR5_9BACT|nr:cold shock and DUF1294 domain-containing protein [Novipirellula galeiformis]TWU21668.1 Cold-shock DNA-binding domain protein [Novipirellula galeiformis]
MRIAGKLVTWKDDRGFGFIAPDGGGDELFVHIKSFVHRSRRPAELDVVTFEQSVGPDGRGQATRVVFEGEPLVKPTLIPIQIVIAISFLLALAALTIDGKLPFYVAGLYATMSVIAFIAYWMDKVAAIHRRSRTPENTLLYLGVIGGWPGALIAQQVFRHKTVKQSFQAGFWVSVVVNCCVLIFLASPALRAYIRSLV